MKRIHISGPVTGLDIVKGAKLEHFIALKLGMEVEVER